jgi:hypothetical protein
LAAHYAGERSHCVTEPDARKRKNQEHAELEGGLATALEIGGGEYAIAIKSDMSFPIILYSLLERSLRLHG